ncbi:TolC family protein [Flammeovirga pectinis]|uniref:TolC family protein n=1 Tax=Flammeovirga pectinis TaxID=2494373 RepID=A0A3Q9FS98_9BACT|nr:TolC family protein [Flammeovirga pectinis]AZQ64749.1 TolC family protein [Flammeovirga pectinis]
MKYFSTTIFIILSILKLQAQNLSLNDAVQKALKSNFDINIERLNVEDASQLNTWGNAGRYPQAQLQIGNSAQFQYTDPASPFALEGKSSNNTLNAGLNLQWVLFNGFNVSFKKEQLNMLEKQASWQLTYQMEEQIELVIQAYYIVQYEKQKLKVLNRILSLSKDKLENSRLQNKVGSGSSFELARDETTFYTDSTNYIDQLLIWENSQRDLNYFMGVENIDIQYDLLDSLNITPKNFNFEQLYSTALKNNTSLNRQKIVEYIQENTIRQKKNLKAPLLAADFGYSGNTNWYTADMPQLEGGFKQETNRGLGFGPNIGVTLSLPIYNGGKNNRQIQSAILQREKAFTERKKIEIYLKNEFTKAFLAYHNEIKKVELSKKSLASADKNLLLSKEQLEQGTITTFEFRQVQNSYLNSSLNLFNSQLSLIQSQITLLRISGSLLDIK